MTIRIPNPYIPMYETVIPRANPNIGKLYVAVDNSLHFLNENGIDTVLASSDGGAILSGALEFVRDASSNSGHVVSVNSDLILSSSTGKIFVSGALYIENKWDDLRVFAQSTKQNPLTSKPDFGSFVGGLLTYLFDPSDKETVHFSIQLPHGYKLGTDLYPHVHWCPTNTNTDEVIWNLEYSIAEISGTFASTSALTASATPGGTAYEHILTSFNTIDGSSLTELSVILICALSRDGASDSYDADVGFLEFDIHYQIDSVGSEKEFIK